MRIAILMGSPRKKDGYRICKFIESSFCSGSEIVFDYLFLKDLHVENCRGCGLCFQKGEAFCPCKDDLPAIKERLLQADGIIFVSPVYACQVTGLMKRTLDRLSYLFHRQEFVGKPALTVVTTDGGGQRETGRYLKMTACGWGCRLVGELQIISTRFFENRNQEIPWGYSEKYHASVMAKIRKAANRLETDILRGKPVTPSYYDLFLFQCLRSKTFVSKADHDFWSQRGWLNSQYFYPAALSPAKKVFARAVRGYVDFCVRRMLKHT